MWPSSSESSANLCRGWMKSGDDMASARGVRVVTHEVLGVEQVARTGEQLSFPIQPLRLRPLTDRNDA